MKRLLNIVSVALFWLIVYAFVYSNSNVTRQYWVDRNGILVDQFHAELLCYGASHFVNYSAEFELIDVEVNGAIKNSEPNRIKSHKPCKVLRFDLPVSLCSATTQSKDMGCKIHLQPNEYSCFNSDKQQYILLI